MRFFITGTSGFIGFHLARRLLREGHEVTGFDGMTQYYSVRLKQARVAELERFSSFTSVVGMLEDQPKLSAAWRDAEPDIVVHLAAQAGVRYSLENPKAYLDANLVGSWNILELARETQVGHLMMASTSSVYGANPTVPFYESSNTDEPLTFYAATKKAVEVIAHSYAHIHKIPVTAFRFFTIYGPSGRPDMAPLRFVKAILEGEEIEVYGHGQMSRDFTYVDDLVEAIVRLSRLSPSEANRIDTPLAADTLSRQAPFRVVNIGGGQPSGLLNFIETIEEATGRLAMSKLLPMQTGDMVCTFASPDLLKALTGFVPQTPLRTGIDELVTWYKANRSLLLEAA